MGYSRDQRFLAAVGLVLGLVVITLGHSRPAIFWQGVLAAAFGLSLAYVIGRLIMGDDA